MITRHIAAKTGHGAVWTQECIIWYFWETSNFLGEHVHVHVHTTVCYTIGCSEASHTSTRQDWSADPDHHRKYRQQFLPLLQNRLVQLLLEARAWFRNRLYCLEVCCCQVLSARSHWFTRKSIGLSKRPKFTQVHVRTLDSRSRWSAADTMDPSLNWAGLDSQAQCPIDSSHVSYWWDGARSSRRQLLCRTL